MIAKEETRRATIRRASSAINPNLDMQKIMVAHLPPWKCAIMRSLIFLKIDPCNCNSFVMKSATISALGHHSTRTSPLIVPKYWWGMMLVVL
jgi:hypothetical protein